MGHLALFCQKHRIIGLLFSALCVGQVFAKAHSKKTEDTSDGQVLSAPLSKAFEIAIKRGLQMGTGDRPWGPVILTNFAEENPLFVGIIADAKRDIVPNPRPKSSHDQYIVSDVVRIGLRLGVGEYVGGDLTARVTFTLSYSKATYEDALNANREIVNWNLPLDLIKDRLPRDESGRYNFVLSRDVDLEGRGWVRSDGLESSALVGTELSVGRVKLARTLVDARSEFDSILVHEDRSLYNNLSYRAYFRVLGLLYLNFLEGDLNFRGHLDGRTYEIADLGDQKTGKALQMVMAKGDFRQMQALKKPLEEISAAFSASRFRMALPLLASLEIRKNRADIEVSDENGNLLRDLFQYNYSKKSRWSFLNSAEDSMVKINVQTPKSGVSGLFGSWSAELSYAVLDQNTRTDEFANYLAFVSAFSNQDAKAGEAFAQHRESKTQDMFVSFGYCEKGIKNILDITPEKFNRALAEVLNVDVKRLEYFADLYRRRVRDRSLIRRIGRELSREKSGLKEGILFSHASVTREIKNIQKQRARFAQVNTADAQSYDLAKADFIDSQSASLAKILRLLSFRGRATYETALIRAINLIAGAENVEVLAQLAPNTVQDLYATNSLDQLVTKRSGGACLNAGEAVVLFPMDAVEQYNALNWVREIQDNLARTRVVRNPSSIWQPQLWWEKLRSFVLNIL